MISNVGQGFRLALSNPKGLPYKINNAFALVVGYWLVVICFLLFAIRHLLLAISYENIWDRYLNILWQRGINR